MLLLNIESIVTNSIIVWFNQARNVDIVKINRVIRTAEHIIGCSLPSLDTIWRARAVRRACSICNDIFHPANELFELLPSNKRFKCIGARTSRLQKSFFPSALRLLNSSHS